MKVFSAEFIDGLVQEAAASPRRRQHHNVHADFAETVQRTFIAIEPGSYVRPHRHGLTPRTETMLAVRGLMALLVFDDAGEVMQVVRFGAGQIGEAQGAAVGVETPPGVWHSLVALEPGSAFIEIKAGPFDPDAPREFAAWAPAEGAPQVEAYLARLRGCAKRMK